MARSRTRNAFLWRPSDSSRQCGELETFGADGDPSDSQIGLDVAPATNGCGAYWGGVAGRSVWRLVGDRPETSLFDSGGAAVDGFLARVGATTACPGGEAPWSVRFLPSEPGARAAVERVTGRRCAPGVVAAVTVPEASPLAAARCDGADGACDAPLAVPLATGVSRQLALLGLQGDGAPGWAVAVGPVADATGVPLPSRAYDLASDGRDWLYLTFVTDGTLGVVGTDAFSCPPLTNGAGPGRWLLALQPEGFGSEGFCAWAQRFGP
ncbi:MAG: hypothetical protein WKG00_35515 [Polyangiaceae bacterium]